MMYNENAMNRTQIYLPKTQRDALRNLARKHRVSVSEVIRMILREKFVKARRPVGMPSPETLIEAAERINKLGGKHAPRDLASRLDVYLYGEK